MNLYQLASQDEAWGAYAPDDDTTPLSVWFADPPAPVPPGPVPIDAALDAAAREYGVDADVLRALGPGSSVDSIFDTAASLRSRLEAFGGDYAQALASYRQEEEGHGGNALAASAAAPLSPPPQADARMPAPAPVPAPAPSGRPTAVAPRPRPARPQATAPVPGPPPSQSARQDLPAAPTDGRLNAANDPRSLMYSQAPVAPRPFVEEVKSQLASGAKTLAQMLPGTGAAARWVANQPEPTTGKAPPASVGSVLEREAVPATDLPSRDLPLRPETRKAANNAWDAASPQDRQRLQSLPGWQGQLARERAAQFAQADKGIFAASPTAALFDTRAEGRTKTLIAKGEHPDFARRAAYEGAAAGVAPGQEVKALGGTVQPSTYDFATKDLFDPDRPANLLNNVVGRGVAKGGLGLGKGVVGISQFIEDLSGADDATKQRTADRATSLRGMEQAIGERGTHLQRNAEGAIASITQQLPMLVTGSFVPSQLLAMGSIAAQSFGQEYSDGKSRGLDPQQAAGRAGAFAAFEVIGEKFGLKGNLDAIRKATQGMPSDAVAGFLANQVKKEIPGEVLTTTGQFAVDKWAPAGMALNPNATFEDYFRQVGDTITQTVMQGGMMNGGRRVLGGMAATAPPAPSAPRAQDQSTTPNPPHTQEATYESGTGSTTAPAPAPAPSPASTAPATGYDGVPVPGNATWSDVATATRKAQAEAEILRQAEALPAQESATSTATAPAPAAPPATPPAPMQASTDGNHSSTQQSADALPQERVSSDAGQAGTNTQASGVPAPAPRPTAADAETNASTTETAPTNLQHGSARHTTAAQIQALDSGMLVVTGDQATVLAHLHAGGVRGAELFMGTTIVPVDQAALAQQVLSRPLAATAEPQAGTGSRRAPAPATANQAQASAAAQPAPAARRGATPTAGSNSTAGSSTAGVSAPRTEHGSPAFQPVPVMEMQRDGTLMVKGDSVQLEERLRAGGVDRVLRREGGVLVGLDQAGKARQLFSNPQSTQDRSGAALPTSAVAQREVATSQSDFVAENHSNGYSDNDGRVQEPTQPDDGRGPTTGRSRATSLDSVRGTGNAVPTGTASLVGSGFAGRIQPADDQGTSQGILRRSGGASLSRRTATLVGLGIAERIERAGSQALLGEQVNSPQRLAELAQVYRDPRFETFRVFFVKDGVVVHATGVSSRMPGTTPMAPAGVSEQEYVNQMRDIKQQTGADSYYLLHNHPSGNPTPSPEDVGLTRMLGAHVPGLLAHVVINSNKYAVIDTANQGREPADMVRYQDFGEDRLLKASKPMAVLGEKMAGPDDFAIVGKSMQRPGWITLIGAGADGKVRAISEAPASILTRSYPYLAATVRRFMRQSGSGSVFAVGDAGDIGSKPVRDALAGGILRDALPDAGRTLHQQGVHTGGTGFSLTRGRRVAEGEPGSSAPSAVRMHTQRDGTLMVKGDPAQLLDRLRGGGVDSVLLRKGGVLVGLDQVHKARQLLQQPPPRDSASAGPSLPSQPSLASLSGQQFSRSAPDQASRANNLPSKPATVQSVKAAVAKLTNSMGLLAEGRGRVVVATSADIQVHWEPLVGEVDMGSQDTGLAQGFFDTKTDTVFLIADHIEAGQEMAVAAHELVHKHGKAVLGEARWRQLHEVIGSWANKPEGSLERQVYDEAAARVRASRPDSADTATYSSEELFPYAVQVAMELGVQPTALMPANSVQGWLARVRAAMRGAWDRLTNKPELFDSQDLVALAFAVAQRENPAYASEFAEASAPVAPRPGITGQQMQGIVDKALDGLGMRGMVAPQIAQSPGVVGLVAPPGTVATGGVYRGELYLFLEGIRDEVEGFRVVFHELFHLGLSQSIQPEEYRQAMLQFLSDPLVRKYAARWRMTEDGQASKVKMPVNNWHAKAVEEAMADISEELHADQRGMGTREMADWVRRTIAWMADLAHRWDMPKVARRLRGMTQTQAEAFVAGTVLKARTGAPVLLPDARWATSREEGRNPDLTQQLDEASQGPPIPRLDVSERFIINRSDGLINIDYLDAENGIHGLNAYVNRDGILLFEIRAQGDASVLGSGIDMFASLMRRINIENIEINGINGLWDSGTDSVNSAEFVRNINAGMTKERAAMSTWTGRAVSKYGYTQVLVPAPMGRVQFAYFRRPNL